MSAMEWMEHSQARPPLTFEPTGISQIRHAQRKAPHSCGSPALTKLTALLPVLVSGQMFESLKASKEGTALAVGPVSADLARGQHVSPAPRAGAELAPEASRGAAGPGLSSRPRRALIRAAAGRAGLSLVTAEAKPVVWGPGAPGPRGRAPHVGRRARWQRPRAVIRPDCEVLLSASEAKNRAFHFPVQV